MSFGSAQIEYNSLTMTPHFMLPRITPFAVKRHKFRSYVPVTQQMLENPSPDDWLMFSRTYDAQRFSPLKQITKQNVGQLRMAWDRGMGAGQTETIPIVHNGVMYVVNPGAVVQALDATNGDVLWEYKRTVPANVAAQARTKSLAIYRGHRCLHCAG